MPDLDGSRPATPHVYLYIMKMLAGLLAALCFVCAGSPHDAQGSARPLADVLLDPPTKRTFEFANGQWFDGQRFQHRTFYSVEGVFSSQRPAIVDEVIDLKNGFVVPPFADAHNHYIAGPHDIRKILDQYLHDGIFYAKNPASIHRDTEMIKD